MSGQVKLAHGSGKGLQELLDTVVIPILSRDRTAVLEDAAVITVDKGRLAFTTDSFVVQPLEFRGGDIGKLAACGTINDLAMMGAVPESLAVSLILEEGLAIDQLTRLLNSLRTVCDDTNVVVSCGDTKVVDKGKADGIFITTSGVGRIPEGRNLSAANVQSGDVVLVSGSVGQHGITILAQRKGLAFASDAVSDCAPLHGLAEALLSAVPDTRVLRDATRGGCAAVLNEIAAASDRTIILDEPAIPVSEVVKGACSYLGMDPLQIANEGRFVAVVPGDKGRAALTALQGCPDGAGAAIIGSAGNKARFPVLLKTVVGGTRPVEVPHGELLPRIC